MDTQAIWNLRHAVECYLNEKYAIGLVKFWKYNVETKSAFNFSDYVVAVTLPIWDSIIKVTLDQLIQEYSEEYYQLDWREGELESGSILFTWRQKE